MKFFQDKYSDDKAAIANRDDLNQQNHNPAVQTCSDYLKAQGYQLTTVEEPLEGQVKKFFFTPEAKANQTPTKNNSIILSLTTKNDGNQTMTFSFPGDTPRKVRSEIYEIQIKTANSENSWSY